MSWKSLRIWELRIEKVAGVQVFSDMQIHNCACLKSYLFEAYLTFVHYYFVPPNIK